MIKRLRLDYGDNPVDARNLMPIFLAKFVPRVRFHRTNRASAEPQACVGCRAGNPISNCLIGQSADLR